MQQGDALKAGLEDVVRQIVEYGITLDQARMVFERSLISAALERQGGNRTRAARQLGIHRNTLLNKMNGR